MNGFTLFSLIGIFLLYYVVSALAILIAFLFIEWRKEDFRKDFFENPRNTLQLAQKLYSIPLLVAYLLPLAFLISILYEGDDEDL